MKRDRAVKKLLPKIALGFLLQLFWVGLFLHTHPNQSLPNLIKGISQRLVLTIQKTAVSVQSLHLGSGNFSPFPNAR
jgi:hypothetical protein